MARQKLQPLVVGNWKMNKTIQQSLSFIEKLAVELPHPGAHVYLAVPFTTLFAAAQAAKGSTLTIGAQNINESEQGAYTGEIAAIMLEEAGAQFVLLGHSERRRLFHETDAIVNKKILRALESHLQPIICIGETLEEKQKGLTEKVLEAQLSASLANLEKAQISKCCIAYEPIWAIGTGNTATTSQAEAAHVFCRQVLSQKFGQEVADQIPLLYGGSVTAENSSDLIKESNIDGLLVGGASLSLDSFLKIIHNVGFSKGLS